MILIQHTPGYFHKQLIFNEGKSKALNQLSKRESQAEGTESTEIYTAPLPCLPYGTE